MQVSVPASSSTQHSHHLHFKFQINPFKQADAISMQSNCYSVTFRKHQQSIKGIRSTAHTKPNETKENALKLSKLL